MNLQEAFATWLQSVTGSTLGQDLYISNAPSSNKTQDAIWWIIATGGNINTDNVTSENLKEYYVNVYYRNRHNKAVIEALQSLEQTLNCSSCVTLDGYEVIKVRASVLSIDEDIDNVDRKVGVLQADLLVYDRCQDVS